MATKAKIALSLVPSSLTTPLLDGSVKIDGVAVVPHAAKSVDDNSRAMLSGGFDVAEMSLATFARAKDRGAKLIGLPVFPGRRFIQPGVAVAKGRRFASPREFAGKTVALPQYWLTSSMWHRGVLQHEYGVAPDQVNWVTAVVERATVHAGGHTLFLRIPMWGPLDAPGHLQHLDRGQVVADLAGDPLGGVSDACVLGGFYGEYEAFLGDLAAGRTPSPSLRESRQSVEIAECLRRRDEEFRA